MPIFSNKTEKPRMPRQIYNSNFTWQNLDGRASVVKKRKEKIDRDIKEMGLKKTIEKWEKLAKDNNFKDTKRLHELGLEYLRKIAEKNGLIEN